MWEKLKRLFGIKPIVRLTEHERNELHTHIRSANPHHDRETIQTTIHHLEKQGKAHELLSKYREELNWSNTPASQHE